MGIGVFLIVCSLYYFKYGIVFVNKIIRNFFNCLENNKNFGIIWMFKGFM